VPRLLPQPPHWHCLVTHRQVSQVKNCRHTKCMLRSSHGQTQPKCHVLACLIMK
jgi:hypothetical protein